MVVVSWLAAVGRSAFTIMELALLAWSDPVYVAGLKPQRDTISLISDQEVSANHFAAIAPPPPRFIRGGFWLLVNQNCGPRFGTFFTFQVIVPIIIIVVVVVIGVLLHAALAKGSDAAHIKAVVGADALKLESIFRGVASYLIAIDITDLGEIVDGAADGLACLRIVTVIKL